MTRENILNTYVLLPTDINGNPDWGYMDAYICSLHHKYITTKINLKSNIELRVCDWREFFLHRIMYADMGNGIDAVLTTSYFWQHS